MLTCNSTFLVMCWYNTSHVFYQFMNKQLEKHCTCVACKSNIPISLRSVLSYNIHSCTLQYVSTYELKVQGVRSRYVAYERQIPIDPIKCIPIPGFHLVGQRAFAPPWLYLAPPLRILQVNQVKWLKVQMLDSQLFQSKIYSFIIHYKFLNTLLQV